MPDNWNKKLVGPEEDPRTSWDTLRAGEIELRTKSDRSVIARTASNSRTTTLAIISGIDCNNDGDLLVAALTTEGDRWQIVERKEVALLLQEQSFDFAKPRGLLAIGDKLQCQFLVLLSKPGKGEERVMRVEIMDVSTGMITRRIHLDSSRELPKTWTNHVIGALSAATDKTKTMHGLHHAITLLGVGTLPQMIESDSARTLVSAGLLSEVDATPGCIALTRTQMEPLVAEQSLGGKNSVWQAGWSLTAGLGVISPEILELRLRLKNLTSGEMFDVSGQKSPTAIRELVKETWAKVTTKAGLNNGQPLRQIITDNESNELLVESRWRMANKDAILLPALLTQHIIWVHWILLFSASESKREFGPLVTQMDMDFMRRPLK